MTQLRHSLLGLEHPEVVKSLKNLVSLYRAQGRRDEADALFKRVLEIYAKRAKDKPRE